MVNAIVMGWLVFVLFFFFFLSVKFASISTFQVL